MAHDVTTASVRARFRAAMVVAIAADVIQIGLLQLFVGGVLSPWDDLLDVVVAAVLVAMVGWHWEFLPSFLGELVPGVDLVPFWTLAVANIYRKARHMDAGAGGFAEMPPGLGGRGT